MSKIRGHEIVLGFLIGTLFWLPFLAAQPFLPAPNQPTETPGNSERGMKLTKWLGLEVTARGVANLRLALLALLPNVSGLVLAFGIALRRSNLWHSGPITRERRPFEAYRLTCDGGYQNTSETRPGPQNGSRLVGFDRPA
jgi:hypothetical protein